MEINIDRSVCDATDVLMAIAEANGVVVFCNKAMAVSLGCSSSSEVEGKILWNFFDPETTERRGKFHAECLKKRKIVTFEDQRAGRWFNSSFVPIESGNVFIIVNENTAKKIALSKLENSEKELKITLDAIAEGVVKWNFQTNEITISDKLCEILGYAPGELPLSFDTCKKLLHPDDFEAAVARAKLYLRTKPDEYDNEFRLRTKDGGYKRLLSKVKIVEKDEAGHAVRMIGNVQDVTDRRRAEAALRMRIELMNFAASHSLEEILTRTLDIVGEMVESPIGFFHFVDEDRKTLSLQAWSTRTLREFCTADRKAEHYHIDEAGVWADCVHRREPVIHNDYASLPHRKGMPEGHAEVVREMAVPIMRKDHIVAILGVGNKQSDYNQSDVDLVTYLADVAWEIVELRKSAEENERLREQFHQSQKMEAVGRLAGGIAHDFNNMLTVINNYSEMIIDSLNPGDPLRADMAEILTAGRRSAELTGKLLAFSRKQIMTPEILDLNSVVKSVEAMIGRTIGENIHLAFHFDENLGYVNADEGQLTQILINLVVNSRDAMPQGGWLTVETSNVELDESYVSIHQDVSPGCYVALSVTDTGCGMERETLDRIFEPFFTTKEKDKGTGLGLSMVYGVIKQSGGHIWVYSEPDKGTTFKIHLPRAIGAAEPARPAASRVEVERGHETILLVEDEPGVLRLMKRALESSGYRVYTAENAGEALLLFQRQSGTIHLIITDVVMPGMGGRDLVDKLKKDFPMMKTRVLFMSGYTENAIAHHGILDKGINFISKPFSLSDLKAKVREVLAD